MKVLLINGSPHPHGSTYRALQEIENVLKSEGIITQIYQIGTKAVHGCIDCKSCYKLGKCVFDDDPANEISSLMKEADGIIIGSPVYYAGPNGALCALLDRVFRTSGSYFKYKLAASIVVARRGGTTSSFDRLNKYFTISNMIVVSSRYWNQVHGNNELEVIQDEEGMQTMRTLGQNMAYLLKIMENNKIEPPELEKKIATNFIRNK